MFKVFLSSTSQDLGPFREAVRHAIDRLDDFKCVPMETFGAREGTPREVCARLVAQCQVLVGLLGHRYGFEPDAGQRSMSEIEYDTAGGLGLPRLMFLSAEREAASAQREESEAVFEKQQRFRARVMQEATVDFFGEDPARLAASVSAALSNWAAAARSSEPAQQGRKRWRLVVGLGGLLAILASFVTFRPAAEPLNVPQQEQKAKRETDDELADSLKTFALLAQVPDPQLRVELLKKILGKTVLDGELEKQVRTLRISGARSAEYEIKLTRPEVDALDTTSARQLLDVRATAGGVPCRGELEFEVRDGLLACKNGAPLAMIQASNSGGPLTTRKLIVFHSTYTRGLEETMRIFQRPQLQASAHLLIGSDGTIVQMVSFENQAWHAGKSRWGSDEGLNKLSLGIELVNLGKLSEQGGTYKSVGARSVPPEQVSAAAADGSRWQTFPKAQIDTAMAVSKALVAAYGIQDIVGHCHISDRKNDPGPFFPFAEVTKIALGASRQLPPCGLARTTQ